MEKCKQRRKQQCCAKEMDLFVTVKLLDDTPAVLSLAKLCEDHGYSYGWTSGQSPNLKKKGRRIQCNTENFVPIVVPGSSTSSSACTSPSTTSLQQDVVDPTSRPAMARSHSVRDLSDWLEEFTENFVDERVPSSRDTNASSSRE